jgi:hypothetical protein
LLIKILENTINDIFQTQFLKTRQRKMLNEHKTTTVTYLGVIR